MRSPFAVVSFIVLVLGAQHSHAAEGEAMAVLANIKARHLPYGAVLDPIFTLTNSDTIAGYTRCGDSALWTGHYLAAEAFRYKVTQAPDALTSVQSAVSALKGLTDVTGTNLLARCMVPANSPYSASIASQEAGNGVYTNSSAGWIWIGNTSRDQYSGSLFGLSVAFDMVDDAATKASIADLITRLVDFLNGHNWSVTMPDGSSGTSFIVRPDQIETFIAVGSHVNPGHFSSFSYQLQRALYAVPSPAPIAFDTLSDDSYFKFNLDYINLYNLIRLDSGASEATWQSAYKQLRAHTALQQNAFFNVIDLALNGPDRTRDAETQALMSGWLLRLRRDFGVDLTALVPVCGSQACTPVPVWLRPNSDFLWQRSPFQLSQRGDGIIETAGIDYILPYWMGRYYGLQESAAVASAATASAVVAPDSLGALYASGLASTVQAAASLPLPMSLGGVTVAVQDYAGKTANAPLLYVSPNQINFLVPPGLAPGIATITAVSADRPPVSVIAAIGAVAPALFSASGTGSGPAAAVALRIASGIASPVPSPIDVTGPSPLYLTLYGTGIRNRSSLNHVLVTINGVSLPTLYAGPQPNFAGLDQINVQLTPELRGSGVAEVVVKVDQHRANSVTVNIQ